MYTNFDYEEERQSMEDKVNQFFGEFSSEIRNKLMSKNLAKPQSLYDVFYPSVKKEMLSKNSNVFNTNLDKISEEIRNEQLAKAIEKITSLEEQSEDFRKSLIARDTLHKNSIELLESFEKKRKDLLSKNTSSLSDLSKDSESYKNKNISKNKTNPNSEKELSESQTQYREENLSHNVSKLKDLIDDSKDYRKEDLSKNPSKDIDLEKVSSKFRENELTLNKQKTSDLESSSSQFRKDDLSVNVIKTSDLSIDSEKFRKEDLSKNASKDINLEESSLQFRKENLSDNVSKNSDLEKDSTEFRKEELSNNVLKNSDLTTDSLVFRESELSRNKTKERDLETDSANFRNADLSANNSIEHDLEKESATYRNNELSNNVSKETDIEKLSKEFRDGELSNNVKKTTDLSLDSIGYQKANLSYNVSKETDVEKDSKEFRNGDLSMNTLKETDLEKENENYRVKNLSQNVSVITNLETKSAPFRDSELSINVPITTNLENDSVGYRDGDLSANVPKTTSLEDDSIFYREGDLSANSPINSDLENDSVNYRDENLSSNVPTITDLETYSAAFRSNELAYNTPIVTNLETDSVTYRDVDLAANTPAVIDLEVDSVLYREENLTSNVPIATDIETDSVAFRNNELSSNVHGSQTIDLHVDQYGTLSSPGNEKKYNLSKNVTSNQTIDKHFDQYGGVSGGENEREKNLSKNVGLGQLGVNVVGPFGTSMFIGVSGVWAQGLIFRNLLTLRNRKYKEESVGNDESDYYINNPFINQYTYATLGNQTSVKDIRENNLLGNAGGGYSKKNKYIAGGGGGSISDYYSDQKVLQYGQGGMLLQNTLKVPSLGEIIDFKALPFTPADSINATLNFNQNIISPIERSLKNAYDGSIVSMKMLNAFSIDYLNDFVSKTIDYELGNKKITGKSFESSMNSSISRVYDEKNINREIREYLKYSNAFMYLNNGNLNTTEKSTSPGDIYQKIYSIAQTSSSLNDNEDKSLLDLINSLALFTEERRNRISKYVSKSLNAPSGVYFNGDVEKSFDASYGDYDNKNIGFKTRPGNPLDTTDFNSETKGVRYILRKIANNDNELQSVSFRLNYKDIQGVENAPSKSFVIGVKNKKDKKAYQKYTIRNPYAPLEAGKLLFYLTNYSIDLANGPTMYFPPYISNFQNSDGASWNSTNFLGRPEAIYTYNNSSRDGSISFFVLTDYAESVMIGREQDENMSPINAATSKNFTVSDLGKSDISTKISIAAIEASKAETIKKLNEQKEKVNQEFQNYQKENTLPKTDEEAKAIGLDDAKLAETEDKYADFSDKISVYQSLINAEEVSAQEKINSLYETNYSESSTKYNNIYNFHVSENDTVDGYKESRVTDTKTRVDEMIKSLSFQPAYFSGSKVDFKNRMEFLAKMTRPANNVANGGFSFTKPPVCHLRLGDWIDHDIIVNSVSYDYANAPWTTNLDGGAVQPMWASVTISFNIVGPAGGSGVPLTSTDVEGFFGTKTIRRSS